MAEPAAKPRKDLLEEAHFRLDEHERNLGQIGKLLHPDSLNALLTGAVAALHAKSQADTEALLRAVQKDSETDLAVVSGLRELVGEIRSMVRKDTQGDRETATSVRLLVGELRELVTALREEEQEPEEDKVAPLLEELRSLVATLRTPTTRTATLALPSGPATMTVKETRQ